MAGVWDVIDEIVEKGQVPKITVAPGSEIVPTRRTPGRPRVADPLNPFAHYKTPRGGYARPRCLVCKRRLRVDDVEVCGDACRDKALQWLSGKLSTIRGKTTVQLTKTAGEYLKQQGLVKDVAT